jgi:phospholipase C
MPDSLPDTTRPAGTASSALPFDHIVAVMMENHSFENLLGALARSGEPLADGLTFDGARVALNSNPGPAGSVRAFAPPTTAQSSVVSQTWNATHRQIDGEAMDGDITTDTASLSDPAPPNGTIFIASMLTGSPGETTSPTFPRPRSSPR